MPVLAGFDFRYQSSYLVLSFLFQILTWLQPHTKQFIDRQIVILYSLVLLHQWAMRPHDKRIKMAMERREDAIEAFKRGRLIEADEAYGEGHPVC